MATEKEIHDLLRGASPEKFRPYAYASGGAIVVYFDPEPDYSEPCKNGLTLYRGMQSGKVVGVRIDMASIACDDGARVTLTKLEEKADGT